MLFPGSRYARTELVEAADGRRSLALRRVPPAGTALEHVVMEGERLDHLASRFYQDATKYWLILDANPEELDPLALLRPGRRVRIPPHGQAGT